MTDLKNLALCILQILTVFYCAKTLAALGAAGVPVPGAAAAASALLQCLGKGLGAAFGAPDIPEKQGSPSGGGIGH